MKRKLRMRAPPDIWRVPEVAPRLPPPPPKRSGQGQKRPRSVSPLLPEMPELTLPPYSEPQVELQPSLTAAPPREVEQSLPSPSPTPRTPRPSQAPPPQTRHVTWGDNEVFQLPPTQPRRVPVAKILPIAAIVSQMDVIQELDSSSAFQWMRYENILRNLYNIPRAISSQQLRDSVATFRRQRAAAKETDVSLFSFLHC